jgi:hypothetical protein
LGLGLGLGFGGRGRGGERRKAVRVREVRSSSQQPTAERREQAMHSGGAEGMAGGCDRIGLARVLDFMEYLT